MKPWGRMLRTAAAFLVALSTTFLADAQTVYTWNVPTPGSNPWSTPGNWNPTTSTSGPGMLDTAQFLDFGSAPNSTTINNVVSVNTIIAVFTCNLTNTSGVFCNTQLPAGVTLTVTGNVNVGTIVPPTGTPAIPWTMSGTGNFMTTGTSSSLNIGTGTHQAAAVTLADGNNTITMGTVNLGNSGSQNGATCSMSLGKGVNTINASTINIGFGKSAGKLNFASSSAGSLTIDGTGGSGTRAAITVGHQSSGTGTSTTSTMALTGHPVGILASTLGIGEEAGNTGGSAAGSVAFDSGTVDATSISEGKYTSGTGTTGASGSLVVGGNASSTALLVVNSPSGPGGGTFMLGNSATASRPGTGTLTINLNGTAQVYCSITKADPTDSTGSILMNGGKLVMESAAYTVGTPAVPINTFSVTNASIHLNVNGSAIVTNIVATSVPTVGTTTITIDSVANVTSSTVFPLISYAGADPFAALSLAPLPAGYLGSLVNNTASSRIDLRIYPSLTIACPGNITTNATQSGGAYVTFSAPVASGGCSSPLNVVSTPMSGSLFPVGTTTVSNFVSDSCGDSTNCTFTVTVNPLTPISLTCPSNITVTATGPSGAVVNFTPAASGGCSPPPALVVNPPSGSTFPIGTTPVSVSASDTCGQSTNCGFTVTVLPQPTPQANEYFTPTLPVLPPPNAIYVSPAQWHALFAQGIVIRDVKHRGFTQSFTPPALGTSADESFGSILDFDLSTDNGATFQPATGTANVTVHVTHSQDSGGTSFYDTEMTQLDLTGPGFLLRESPTLQSTGQTTIRPVTGGYMVSSFFDVFTEVSTDGGASWQAASQSGHVEMRPDPQQVTPVPEPTPLLPPPNDHYVSPAQWHALFAQGIVIRNVSHRLFTGSLLPPSPGATNTHIFNSQIDLDISSDGGSTFQTVRVAAPVQVTVANNGSAGNTIYDTQMTSLSLPGLPGGIMVRESPTLPSRGVTEVDPQPDGTFHINSFFDIFTEVSLDGGATWSPATNGPVRMGLTQQAPEVTAPNGDLPLTGSSYVSPAKWHALYANGIVLTNVAHRAFTANYPPPVSGGSNTESFNSIVDGQISLNGGASFQPFSAPASVGVSVNSRSDLDNGNTRYFDTEMTALNLSGGSLPSGMMVRESPSKASLGRTSVRNDSSGFHISSFFDVFTEISLDGGSTWSPSVTAPGTMSPQTNGPSSCVISITCPSNITVTNNGPTNVFFTVNASDSCGGSPGVISSPASGSTFGPGTTTVTNTASDANGTNTCTFTVTVVVPPTPQAKEYYSPGSALLPPPNSVYISPAQWHALFAQGIVIRDVRHRGFTQNFTPPSLGNSATESFSSILDFDLSTDNGATFHPATGTANVTVHVTHSQDVGGTSFYNTEMTQLDLNGPGFLLRESPTLQSTGQTTIRPVTGGFMVSSFFDIFTEISLDGGASWTPASQSGHVEMRPDPQQVTGTPEPTPLLPPPNDHYISPAQWHALYASGIVIRNVSHRLFTGSLLPPTPGVTNMHSFDSQIDLQYSSDGGSTFQQVRVTAPVQVTVANNGSGGNTIYDTEMTSLSLSGLPGGAMLRASPTEPSRGVTEVDPQPDGTFHISSFFDIFTELSLDGGVTWAPATNGPVRMQLTQQAPEVTTPNGNLPLTGSSYVSPAQWHALYANGIILTNVSHSRFTQTQPPPIPGGNQTESFGSTITGQISLNGGASFQPFSAPASVGVSVNSRADLDNGNTRYFDTQMTQLDLSGGSLPGGVMVRQSPSEQSLGRTTVRSDGSGYHISSFFDVFTEISLDNGSTWSPSTTAPGTMSPQTNGPTSCTISITCPPNITVTNNGPTNVFFTVNASDSCGGVPNVTASPPSGSTFGIGTTMVNSTASDSNGTNMCSFSVTVVRPNCTISITCPSNITVTSSVPTNVFFTVNASDSCGGVPNIVASPPSGSTFPIGTTMVNSTASDANGTNMCSFSVTVVRPNCIISITCPTNIVVTNNGPTNVFFTVTASDSCGGTPGIISSPPSGSTFPIGTTMVNSTASDANGTNMCSFSVTVVRPNCIISINCPSNITVMASGPGGAVVNFTVPASDTCGGTPTVSSVPPSGSTFPVGTTMVNSTASDANGTNMCSFTVTVLPPTPQVKTYFALTNLLPPTNMVYISPAQWHVLFANGIVIRNVRHRFFTQHFTPPSLGNTQMETFGSELDFDLSTDNGTTYHPATGTATVTVQVTHSQDSGGTSFYNTEMTQLDLTGPGFLLRESPTLQSTGQTTIQPMGGGFMVSSFFDIFTEVSLDGGASWTPAQQAGHVEMRPDPLQVTGTGEPTPLLPPPNDAYVSPAQWHALYAQGIVIKNVSHKLFTGSLLPPAPGVTNTHSFGSVLDLDVSTDGGTTYQSVRVTNAPVQVTVTGSSASSNNPTYDTEMTALNLTLPSGVMVRESPTLPSRGTTEIDPQSDGTFHVSSFFDIFTEVSLDGGASWSPATNGPVRMQLTPQAPEVPTPGGNLPLTNRPYVSPAQWHAAYANGIYISNVTHRAFTANYPPPPAGMTNVENFNSLVDGLISLNGGASFTPFTAPASVAVNVNSHSSLDTGNTRFFDTQMTSLNLSGGNLPGGIMVRQSPTKGSLGRTSVRNDTNGFHVSSFFDIFTEISLDGGNTWSPNTNQPVPMSPTPTCIITITCPPTITVTSVGPAVVSFPVTASDSCGNALSVVSVPPSGSTFPEGTNTVVSTAGNADGTNMCSFNIIVKAKQRVFPSGGKLPPTNSIYISPAQWHAAYANGVYISNVVHRAFTANYPPPANGTSSNETFNSKVDFLYSADGGHTFQKYTGNAACTVRVTSIGAQGSDQVYQTQMTQLDLGGGTMPAGVQLRASPTKPSTGETRITPTGTGTYQISSFFDIFTELSLDGGNTWTPSSSSGHMELHIDPANPPTYLVQPQFPNDPIYPNDPIRFSIATLPGLRYTVQYKNNLADTTWTLFNVYSGTGQTIPVEDTTAAGSPHRFYRVMIDEDPNQ